MASVPFKFSKVTVGDDFFDDVEPTYSVRLSGTTIGEVTKGEILVDPDDESLGWETRWTFVLTEVPYGKVLPEGRGKWGEGKSRPAAILDVLDRLEVKVAPIDATDEARRYQEALDVIVTAEGYTEYLQAEGTLSPWKRRSIEQILREKRVALRSLDAEADAEALRWGTGA